MMVAALYVQPRGCYTGLAGVEPWGLPDRDAREYAGPHPVVAHPPCERWCRLAGLVEARCGHRRGDDGGCFAAALASVRRWCGVLEHPAWTSAWAAHGLTSPGRGGWYRADEHGGWACQVDQCHYGHRARKRTWLYAVGCELPSLVWMAGTGTAVVSDCGNHARGRVVERMSNRERNATPPAFRDILLAMARTVTS